MKYNVNRPFGQLCFSVILCVLAFVFAACSNTNQPSPSYNVSKPDSVYVYTVDTSGNETLNRIIYYSYDAAKNQTCVQESFCTSKQIHKTEFQYNAKGLMIKKKEMFYSEYSDPAGWNTGIYTIYTYDDKNKLSSLVDYVGYDDPLPEYPYHKGICSWTDDYNMECLVYEYEFPSNDSVVEKAAQKLYTTYNTNGDILQQRLYFLFLPVKTPDGEKPNMVSEYTYDKYGNATSYTETTYNTSGLANQFREERNQYDYDEKGKILVRLCTHIDQLVDKRWEKKEKYVYYY